MGQQRLVAENLFTVNQVRTETLVPALVPARSWARVAATT